MRIEAIKQDLRSPFRCAYKQMMVNLSLDWKVLKIPFILHAFLITLRRFDTLGGHFKDERKSSYDFMFPKGKSGYFFKCIYKNA